MSLNVRQPDGANNWEYRKELLLETILGCRPDAIGKQELFVLQGEFLTARAPQYGWFGAGRFGDDRDKHVGVFYCKDTLRLLANGDFWLSETPELPGSSSWEIIRPRQVRWGRSRPRAALASRCSTLTSPIARWSRRRDGKSQS